MLVYGTIFQQEFLKLIWYTRYKQASILIQSILLINQLATLLEFLTFKYLTQPSYKVRTTSTIMPNYLSVTRWMDQQQQLLFFGWVLMHFILLLESAILDCFS